MRVTSSDRWTSTSSRRPAHRPTLAALSTAARSRSSCGRSCSPAWAPLWSGCHASSAPECARSLGCCRTALVCSMTWCTWRSVSDAHCANGCTTLRCSTQSRETMSGRPHTQAPKGVRGRWRVGIIPVLCGDPAAPAHPLDRPGDARPAPSGTSACRRGAVLDGGAQARQRSSDVVLVRAKGGRYAAERGKNAFPAALWAARPDGVGRTTNDRPSAGLR